MPNLKVLDLNDRIVRSRVKPMVARERQWKLLANMTPAEKQMEQWLNESGHKFKSQEIFTMDGFYYIADFWLPKCRVVLELDGSHHFMDWGQEQYDIRRDKRISEHNRGNIEVIRIPNACTGSDDFKKSLFSLLESRREAVARWARAISQKQRDKKWLQQNTASRRRKGEKKLEA